MQEFRAVLFDLDGTLVDSGDLIVESAKYTVSEIFGEIGHSEVIIEAIGKPLKQQMDFLSENFFGTHRSVEGVHAQNAQELSAQMMSVYSAYCKMRHDELMRPFVGIETALEALRQKNVPMGVVTSKRREPAVKDLAHFGLDSFFLTMVAADDLSVHKPHPEPLWRGMELLSEAKRLELSAEQCIYVGDSPFDIQAAHAAGMHAVAVTYGIFSREVLEREEPKEFFDSPASLAALALRF